MSNLVYRPDTCADVAKCEDDQCPESLYNCGRGRSRCWQVDACKPTTIPIDLGCNRLNGLKLKTSDMENITFSGHYDSEDGRVDAFSYSLVENPLYFEVDGAYRYQMTIPAAETATWPAGALNGEIIFNTATHEYLRYDFNVCVERPIYAPPCLVVSGESGAPSPFVVNQNTVQLWLHESDIVHNGMEWNRFEIEWGDGNSSVVAGAATLSAAIHNATHTYTELGEYEITIKGYNTVPANDPCAPTLETCVAVPVCINSMAVV